MTKPPNAPQTLGRPGRDYWRTLHASFAFEPTDTPMIHGLCSLIDRLHEIREAIAKQGISVTDRFGIAQPNKLLEHERSTVLAASRVWRELGCGSATDSDPARLPSARGYK